MTLYTSKGCNEQVHDIAIKLITLFDSDDLSNFEEMIEGILMKRGLYQHVQTLESYRDKQLLHYIGYLFDKASV